MPTLRVAEQSAPWSHSASSGEDFTTEFSRHPGFSMSILAEHGSTMVLTHCYGHTLTPARLWCDVRYVHHQGGP